MMAGPLSARPMRRPPIGGCPGVNVLLKNLQVVGDRMVVPVHLDPPDHPVAAPGFALFIKRGGLSGGFGRGFGAPGGTSDTGKPIESLEQGMIRYLPPGEEVFTGSIQSQPEVTQICRRYFSLFPQYPGISSLPLRTTQSIQSW